MHIYWLYVIEDDMEHINFFKISILTFETSCYLIIWRSLDGIEILKITGA
jgi:hypothetical protein